jgi:hypothetical protein
VTSWAVIPYDRDNDVSSGAGLMQVPECGDQEIERTATPVEYGAGEKRRGKLRMCTWAVFERVDVKGGCSG